MCVTLEQVMSIMLDMEAVNIRYHDQIYTYIASDFIQTETYTELKDKEVKNIFSLSNLIELSSIYKGFQCSCIVIQM